MYREGNDKLRYILERILLLKAHDLQLINSSDILSSIKTRNDL